MKPVGLRREGFQRKSGQAWPSRDCNYCGETNARRQMAELRGFLSISSALQRPQSPSSQVKYCCGAGRHSEPFWSLYSSLSSAQDSFFLLYTPPYILDKTIGFYYLKHIFFATRLVINGVCLVTNGACLSVCCLRKDDYCSRHFWLLTSLTFLLKSSLSM